MEEKKRGGEGRIERAWRRRKGAGERETAGRERGTARHTGASRRLASLKALSLSLSCHGSARRPVERGGSQFSTAFLARQPRAGFIHPCIVLYVTPGLD